MSDYEITWDDKKIIPTLKKKVCDMLGEEAWDKLVDGIDVPDPDTEKDIGCKNIKVMIERLEKMAKKETIKGILFRVRHGFTNEQIGNYKEDLIECNNNIDVYLERSRQKSKEEFIKHNTEGTKFWGDLITDEALHYLLNTEGILAPVRKGAELHITRYPYDMTNYFNETDERKKRFHFCHCLFARNSILNGEGSVSKTMCYCSLGLAKAPWEATFDVELDGEIVESVLNGDNICRFVIYLPDDIIKKYT